jgi:putative membrane protein
MSSFQGILFGIWSAVFLWSGIEPFDRFTWFLEVLPAILALAAVAVTHRRFPLTRLVTVLICLHCIVLMVGGKYTYAEMPLFNWLRDNFHLARNYYDRVGHFMQGFVPALVIREVFLRLRVVRRGGWLHFLVVCVALAFSAFYEFIEWWVALLTGESATAFLGTQGDPWDTQWDMFLCTVGSVVSLALLHRRHDRELRLDPAKAEP